jgi:hypothetical protein
VKKISTVVLYPVKGKNSFVEYYVTIGDDPTGASNPMCGNGQLTRVFENNDKETFNCDLSGSVVSVRGVNNNNDWSFLCEIEAFGTDAPSDYVSTYRKNILTTATSVSLTSYKDNDSTTYDKKYLTDGSKEKPSCTIEGKNWVTTNANDKTFNI